MVRSSCHSLTYSRSRKTMSAHCSWALTTWHQALTELPRTCAKSAPATVSVHWRSLTTWWMSPYEKLLPVSQARRCPGYEWTSQWGRTWKAFGHNFLVLWRRLVGCLIVTLLTVRRCITLFGPPTPAPLYSGLSSASLDYHSWPITRGCWVIIGC